METQKRKKFLIMIKPETVPLSIPEEMCNAGGCLGEGAAAHFGLTLQQCKKEKLSQVGAAGRPGSANTMSSAPCVSHKLMEAYVNISCLCKILYWQGHALPSADSKLQNRENSWWPTFAFHSFVTEGIVTIFHVLLPTLSPSRQLPHVCKPRAVCSLRIPVLRRNLFPLTTRLPFPKSQWKCQETPTASWNPRCWCTASQKNGGGGWGGRGCQKWPSSQRHGNLLLSPKLLRCLLLLGYLPQPPHHRSQHRVLPFSSVPYYY